MLAHPAWNHPPGRPRRCNRDRNPIAYRIVLVAALRRDLALSSKRGWDIAAAEIIVREAGGVDGACRRGDDL